MDPNPTSKVSQTNNDVFLSHTLTIPSKPKPTPSGLTKSISYKGTSSPPARTPSPWTASDHSSSPPTPCPTRSPLPQDSNISLASPAQRHAIFSYLGTPATENSKQTKRRSSGIATSYDELRDVNEKNKTTNIALHPMTKFSNAFHGLTFGEMMDSHEQSAASPKTKSLLPNHALPIVAQRVTSKEKNQQTIPSEAQSQQFSTYEQETPSPINITEPATPRSISDVGLPFRLAEHNSTRSERFAETWLRDTIGSPSFVIRSAARSNTRENMDNPNSPTAVATDDGNSSSIESLEMFPFFVDEDVTEWEPLESEAGMHGSSIGPTSFFRDMYEMTMRSRMYPEY
ncbi:MAG: hypothetical protein Q9174_004512 [Haloplaca sp. 1 TL-2023]